MSDRADLLMEHPIGGRPALGGQAQIALLLQFKQQRASGHVFELPVGSAPLPEQAQLHGEPIPAPLRMALQQIPQLLQLSRTDDAALKDEGAFHSPTMHQTERRVQRRAQIFFGWLPAPKPTSRQQLPKTTF